MMFKKSPLKPASIRKRKRNRFAAFSIAALVGLGLLSWGVIAVARLHALSIQEINVNGNKSVDTGELQKKIEQQMSGAYWKFFPKRNITLYPKKQIEEEMRAAYPQFSSVALSLQSFKNLSLSVEERIPAGLWCESVELDGIFYPRDNCYFMDVDGFIYASAAAFSGNVYSRYYGLVDPERAIGSTFLLSPDISLSEASQFIADTERLGSWEVDGFFARGNGDFELQLRSGGIIKLNDREPLLKTLSNLETVLNQSNLKKAAAEQIRYIDLRFGNKVFYKIKSGAGDTVEEQMISS